jgi:hypothetical protein
MLQLEIKEQTFHTLDGMPITWYYVENNQKDIMFETRGEAETYLRVLEVENNTGFEKKLIDFQ